jgi:PPOX class probable F420-dependent enzyme
MRRNLRPEDLGDLLDQPRNAIIGIHGADGSILLTPVWFLFRDGTFLFQVPGGDRKIALLRRDPTISILVAEDDHPYRAIEVHGVAHLDAQRYEQDGREITRPYVDAYDPGADLADYMVDGGVVVTIEATSTRAWDYADSAYH